MADIRGFFSPSSGKQRVSSSSNGATHDEKPKSSKKSRVSSTSEVKRSRKQVCAKESKMSRAKRAIVISESDEDGDFVKTKKKKGKNCSTSDSEEDPIPLGIRKSASIAEKSKIEKRKGKKSTYFDDESDEEAPIKVVSKAPKSAEKPKKLQSKSKQVTPVKPKTPEKHVTSVDDFFGSAPVQRSASKSLSTKRKQPSQDTPEKTDSSSLSPSKAHKSDEQPVKKRKEDTSPLKNTKSPAKEQKPTLSAKLSKAASKLFVPDTPTPVKREVNKEKPHKTPSPVKPKIEPLKKKNSTPDKPKVEDDIIPPSLEKKKSNYKSFMQRDGPQALGSKEIPQGADNCFEGKTFVITGILESIEREEAQDIIQRYGGKVTLGVSKKTTYLIVGRDPGVSKTSKAEKLGTKTINEDEFFDIIKTTPGKKSSYDEPSPGRPPAKKPKTSVYNSPLTKPSMKKLSGESPSSSQGGDLNSQKSTSSVATPATQTPSGSPSIKEESLMWVDKYKPANIKQIIGQQGDKSNMRKLINWIKNWNKNRTKTHPKTSFFAKDQDGAILKAALLSGPPGVGKTTTAVLVCQELGYSYVEMNASDSRNKKCLEQHVSGLLSNKSIDAFVGGSNSAVKDSSKHVLIMDEVDGMAGNEDRGGMQELISLIKNSKIPIICMCNDRNSQKIRSLVNYCFDLRFQRPRVEQIKGAMMSIAFKEGLKIPPPAMDQVIIGANQDVRQVLHNMSMWTATNKSMTYDQAKEDAHRAHKDIKMGPFDAIRRLLSYGESSKLSLIDKSDLFFCDYSLMPLFVQQNYLSVRPAKAEGSLQKTLDIVSKTADSISDGDLVEKQIRSNNNWSLLPTQAIFSSVIPSYFISGGMDQRIDFPQWLGKNSKRGRLDRILQELQAHMRLSTSADKASVNLDYIPSLRRTLTVPLMDESNSKEGVSSIIQLLEAYNLTREDWDSIMEAGQYDGHRDPMTMIPSKVKGAFTRAYNKEQHKTPYVLKGPISKSRGKVNLDAESQGMGEDELENEEEEEEESIENSAMLVKNKKPSKAKSEKKGPGSSRGKGRGKGRS